MRAITIPRFGGPEVLELSEGEDPAPKPGQVAIDVAFAGVNYAEVLYRRGAVDVELPFIPGIEVAGHVRSLGEGVEGLAAGDRVAGLPPPS
jgi:NADPH:quinone reductase